METPENAETPKNAKNKNSYSCYFCDFYCFKKSDWTRHLTTLKHKNCHKEIVKETPESAEIQKNAEYLNYKCKKCQAKYKSSSGLWKHNLKCETKSDHSEVVKLANSDLEKYFNSKDLDDMSYKELFIMVMKQNAMIIEKCLIPDKMIQQANHNNNNTITSNNNNTTNSHNKAFNLNFFLNETCKDAMNITEFIENIKIDVSDLENMGRVGYVEGMSNILIKNLNTLDVSKRPIHCTDKKREVMYIKDNNVWEKDDEQKNKLHKTIKRVSHKSIKTLPAYRDKYPGCEFAISKFSDNYNKMIIEVMGGSGDNDVEKEDKIIQKVAKHITINKEYTD
jgi:hypothetical protein